MVFFLNLESQGPVKKKPKSGMYLCSFFHYFFSISNVDKVHVSEIFKFIYCWNTFCNIYFQLKSAWFFFGCSTNSQAPVDINGERCPEEAIPKEHYPREDSLSVGVSKCNKKKESCLAKFPWKQIKFAVKKLITTQKRENKKLVD